MNIKHTPGKLRLGKPFNGFIWSEDPTRGDKFVGANWAIADVKSVRNRERLSEEDEANAERLVLCWNCHDALKEALQQAQDTLAWAQHFSKHANTAAFTDTLEITERALAKANNPKGTIE